MYEKKNIISTSQNTSSRQVTTKNMGTVCYYLQPVSTDRFVEYL